MYANYKHSIAMAIYYEDVKGWVSIIVPWTNSQGKTCHFWIQWCSSENKVEEFQWMLRNSFAASFMLIETKLDGFFHMLSS
jgi:hypothetical protein